MTRKSANKQVDKYKARAPDLRSDWIVPLAQAATTGVIIGALLALLASATGRFTFLQAFGPCFLVALAGGWLVHLDAAQRTLWAIESVLNVDLDNDNEIGQPDWEPEPPRMLAINPYAGRQAQQQVAREEQIRLFVAFVMGCAAGSTGLRRWEAKIGRETYTLWRDTLINSGYASWNNPKSVKDGWRLTSSAEDILGAFQDEKGQPLSLPSQSTLHI